MKQRNDLLSVSETEKRLSSGAVVSACCDAILSQTRKLNLGELDQLGNLPAGTTARSAIFFGSKVIFIKCPSCQGVN